MNIYLFIKEIEKGNLHVFKLNDNFNKQDVNYFISFFQVGKRSKELDVLSSLLCYCYNNYLVSPKAKIEKVYKDNWIYLRVMLYSCTNTPKNIAYHFENELATLIDGRLDKLSLQEFDSAYDFIKKEYAKNELRLRHRAIKYWYEIYERTNNFKRYDDIREYLEKVDKQQLLQLAKTFLYDTLRDKIRRVEFWLYHVRFDGDLEEDKRRINAIIHVHTMLELI